MQTLVELIETFPRRNKVALVYHNGFRTFRYSYRDVYAAIRRTAAFLEEQGVRSGNKVALWGTNQPEWVFAYFGAVYCGAVIVPIDLQARPEAAEKICEHAGVSLLIKSNSRKTFLTERRTIFLEDLEYEIENMHEKDAVASSHFDDLVELVYTSGTTGEPKGVMLTHANLLANLKSIQEHIELTENDTSLSLLPLSHMFEQMCGLLVPLSRGMTIVYTRAITPASIFRALKREHITIVVVVPRILQSMKLSIAARLSESGIGRFLAARIPHADTYSELLKSVVFSPIRRKFGRSFRMFVCGGAYLDRDTEIFWNRLGLTVLQGYGLTECSPVLAATKEGATKIGAIGKPLSGVEMRLSKDGEIVARGRNIFKGYFRDEEKTNAAFRDGWFLTGDIGEYDADGDLFIKGRKKDVIVTAAGKNVYPDDIESVLNAISGIKESCVVGVKGALGEEVHAVIVPKGTDVSASAVLAAVNKKLDSSQHVQTVTAWHEAELPKTTTLKVKRALIKAYLEQKEASTTTGALEARTKLQWMVAEVTGRRIEEVSDDKRLYADLRLDSIGRIELVSRITSEFNFDIEEELINEQTTVGALQDIVTRRTKGIPKWEHPLWPHRKFMRIVRFLGMELVNANFPRLFTRLTVKGRENLEGLEGPVIFAANHVSYADFGNVFRALPLRFRYTLAAPAYAEFFLLPPSAPRWERLWKGFSYYWASATMGLFLLSRENGQRRGLEQAGMIVDNGESILIFPEGERTRNMHMLPFKKGTAILAKNLRIPIVPVGHRGLEYIFPSGAAMPRFGRMTLTFGKPFYVKKESIEEATEKLQTEIERLRKA